MIDPTPSRTPATGPRYMDSRETKPVGLHERKGVHIISRLVVGIRLSHHGPPPAMLSQDTPQASRRNTPGRYVTIDFPSSCTIYRSSGTASSWVASLAVGGPGG